MTSPATECSLQLGDQARVHLGDGRCVALGPSDALLLAWLALEGPSSREQLASLLWPGSEPEHARNALRQRLFRLRRQCGRALVEGGAQLRLTPGLRHDLGDAAPASRHLLAGVDDSGPDPAAAWLQGRRRQHEARWRAGVLARIDRLEADGETAQALPLALALVDADPASEESHRRVMRLHYLRGDRSAALLAFDRLEAWLKHELGSPPSAATLSLLASISRTDAEPADHGPAPEPRAELPASVLRPPRLIGRMAELEALDRAWGAATPVLLVGEAGIGKSRLLQAFCLGRDGVIRVAARPQDALTPHASLGRLVHAALAFEPACMPQSLRPTLAALWPDLLPGSAPVRASRAPLAAALQAWLDGLQGRVEGWVLDDLHFADEASLDLLQPLLAGLPEATSMRWCFGSRPPSPGGRLSSFVDALAARPLTRLDLTPLDEPQIAQLVDSLGLPGVEGSMLAGSLRQRSGGNPLFALETLKLAWADGGLGSARELPRPASLQQLLAQQLQRLSPPALALARVAAVAGVDFGLALAEKVLARSALLLTDAWAELERRQVLVGAEFAHDLILEAVLAGVPAVIARHLHGQVAEALEHADGEPARVAAHWEAAGHRARALPGLQHAADRAHRALREQERLGFLLRAADIAEDMADADTAFDCVAQACETHMNSIRQADGYPLLDRLDRLAHSPRQRAQALGLRAWYCAQLADGDAAVRLGLEALAMALPLADATLEAQVRQRLATSLAMVGRFDDALPHLAAVQDWAAAALPSEDLAEFHGNFAVVLDNLGRPGEAWPHHERARLAAMAAGDPNQQATQLANQAVNRLNAGHVDEARELLRQAEQGVRALDRRGSSAAFLRVLSMQCARAQGCYAEALAASDDAEDLLRSRNPARLPIVQLLRAHAWIELGQWTRAIQALDACAGQLPPHYEARRGVLVARLARWRGRPAPEALQAARRVAPANGWPEARLAVDLEQAEALPAAQAAQLLRAARAEARAMGLDGVVLAATMRLARLQGSAEEARQALELARHCEASGLYRGELWFSAALALEAAGDAEARAVARQGWQWARQVARDQVPAAYRDSFLTLNPINVRLRTLAG